MNTIYLLEILILTISAVSPGAIYGRFSRELELPLAWLCENICWTIPVVIIPLIFKRLRDAIGPREPIIHIYAIFCVFAPVIYFKAVTQKIPIRNSLSQSEYLELGRSYDGRFLRISEGDSTFAVIPSNTDRNDFLDVLKDIKSD